MTNSLSGVATVPKNLHEQEQQKDIKAYIISLNSSRRYLVSSLGKDNGSALLIWRQRATAQALQKEAETWTVITCGGENRFRAMLTSVSVAKEALAQAIAPGAMQIPTLEKTQGEESVFLRTYISPGS